MIERQEMRRDPGLYDYAPLLDRPRITWPNGARVAFWVAPNIEFYELHPPVNPTRKSWPRPEPDVSGYSHRDHGNRVGLWRLFDVMDRCGMRGSVSLNVAVCEHHPEIIKQCADRGWEFFSHGIYNTRYTYGMSDAQQMEMIRDVQATIKNHTGQDVAGWLSPALTNTETTMDLLAEAGLKYTCDLFHDEQPQPVNVRSGRLISVPYSLEMNDFTVLYMWGRSSRQYANILKAQFDQLFEEGAESGKVMCIPLHPYLIGQANRIGPFEELLNYICNHDKVWLATGREIADWYYEHNYDEAVSRFASARGN
jgi:allantoinase